MDMDIILSLGIIMFSNVAFHKHKLKIRCRVAEAVGSPLSPAHIVTGAQTKSCLLVTYTIADVHLSVLYESSVLHG